MATIAISSGCGQRYSNYDWYMGRGDFNFRYFGGVDRLITESEAGYYFIVNNFVFYADKGTMVPVVLCGRPHCLHYNETNEALAALCNAIFPSWPGSYIEYYDNNLYIFANHVDAVTGVLRGSLFRVSLDGSRRDIMFDTPTWHTPSAAAIHRGTIYFTTAAYTIDGASRYGIMAFDLNRRRSRLEMVYAGTESHGAVGSIFAYGNNLYFHESAINRVFMNRFDIVNRTADRPFAKPPGIEWNQSFETIHNGRILYANWQMLLTTPPGQVEQLQLYISNLDGQEPIRQVHLETSREHVVFGRYRSDGVHLWYSDEARGGTKPMEERGTWVLDLDTREVIATVSHPPEMPSFGAFISGALIPGGKYHAFFIIGGLSEDDPFEIWYADKSLIETGSLEWRPLIQR